MPLFSDLRSDYPLNLTLLERPYAGALKQSYRAGLTSARGIPVPLIGSTWWFLSRLLVDRAFDAQHYSGTNGRHCHSVDRAHICAATLNSIPASWRLPCWRLSQRHVWLSRSTGCHSLIGTVIGTVLCPAFQMRNSTAVCASGLLLSGVPVGGQQGKSDQLKSDQLRRST